MIDIYDEVGYIKNILVSGISEKWERDAILLSRFYKQQGLKKSEIKERIKEKCEKSKKFSYNHLVNFKRLNSIIDKAWKKEVPLREIKDIEIAQEVVDWFLGLEDMMTLSDEQVEEFKVKRPKIVIKNNKPINWARTKYLFTLYIWTKVQEHYLDKPYMHYLKKYNSRFKEDADLKSSFNMQHERDFLFDLGFIDINYALGINATFIEKYDVFKTPVTDKNRVIISTGEIGQGDLYRCGYWLEKQKMGSFICQNCGREFAHYTTSKKEKSRKYCKECSDLIRNGVHSDKTRTFICIDCGKEVVVSNKNQKSVRCYQCQHKTRMQKDLERKRVSVIDG